MLDNLKDEIINKFDNLNARIINSLEQWNWTVATVYWRLIGKYVPHY